MSWSEFMETKCFGGGIFRPYADFLSDIQDRVDHLLGNDPSLARFTKSLTERDFYFVRGQNIALLCVSDGSYRHYPLRESLEWESCFMIQEVQFIANHPGIGQTAITITVPELNNYLSENLNFKEPTTIGFPGIYNRSFDSPLLPFRTAVIFEAARLLVESDRLKYENHIEMQKPKNIFLSHKSADKSLIREISSTLHSIGFSPWLDEDQMKAGASLERAIKQGFEDSCAAVFFVTPNFTDENFLATEIDYAIAEKRSKGSRFSIITLLIPDKDGVYGKVPSLLRTYVWKQIQPIEIVRTIAEALPIECGEPVWRN